MFYAGQKVVCVDDQGVPKLVKGCVYTIRDIVGCQLALWRDVLRPSVGILLYEVEVSRGFDSFAPERFRPVIERKTDISIFTAMLGPEKHGVEA